MRYNTTVPANTKCWICERITVEPYVDPETGEWTHNSTCSPACWAATCSRPYCFTPECSGRVCGTQTIIVNGREIPNGVDAIYECSGGCGKRGTRAEWSHAANFASGYRDKTVAMQGIDPWLVETRLRNIKGDGLVSYQDGVNAAVAGAAYDPASGTLDTVEMGYCEDCDKHVTVADAGSGDGFAGRMWWVNYSCGHSEVDEAGPSA